MNSELIPDLVSQNVLLEEINNTRKRNSNDGLKKNAISKSFDGKKIPSRYNKKYFVLLSIIVFSALLIFFTGDFVSSDSNPNFPLRTQYLIQNLRGDTTDTWVSWNLTPNRVLTFTILGASIVSDEQISKIKDVVLSEETLEIDNSLLHKGLEGTSSMYYLGWQGATQQVAKNPTKLVVPQRFEYVSPSNGVADVTIMLTTTTSGDGYAGYTNSVVDDAQILKSTITIYAANKLSTNQLTTIIRHEFGHAIGLAHSTANEDLMHETIFTAYPFISPCVLDAVEKLYDGNQKSKITCEI
jgi:predicted Zn-dependent protease